MTDKISFTIVTHPARYENLKHTLATLPNTDLIDDIVLCCNPANPQVNYEYSNFRQRTRIFQFESDQSLSYGWNQSIINSKNRYVIICNDDVEFPDSDFAQKILDKHKEGYGVVFATEYWSCFSIDKALIARIGWFEEFLPYAWEDVDYNFRLNRNNEKLFRFAPFGQPNSIVRHLRAQSARDMNKFHTSSERIFRKWNLKEYLRLNEFPDAKQREKTVGAGIVQKIIPEYLNPNWETPNYYPKERNQYAIDFA